MLVLLIISSCTTISGKTCIVSCYSMQYYIILNVYFESNDIHFFDNVDHMVQGNAMSF